MCMDNAEGRFWAEREQYHDLAREFEQNIEITHPDYVTSRGVDPMMGFFSKSFWAATNVKYYEHRA